ncbi:MAG: zinc ABC transporter substrate-binding protein [Verrucomicrobiota bacterium]
MNPSNPSPATAPSPIPRLAAALAVAILALGPVACSDSSTQTSSTTDSSRLNYPYTITCTVGMIADIAQNVAGDKANVNGIIGEGVDPHLYKPTSTDIKQLQSSDVVFYNGLMLEGKMGDILVRVAGTGKPVKAVTEDIVLEDKKDDSILIDEEGHFDPHVWMDVSGWKHAVNIVTNALANFDPENADYYKGNAKAYLEKLDALDDYARTAIASIPENQRVLVTAHDAFNYMARAYDLDVRGIQGISTESEAGVKDIEDLVTFLVDHQIPAVFVESSVSDKNVRALVEGAKAKGQEVVIGGELFSDAMGPADTYEGTYIGMIDHNVTTIARALGGEAPEKGLDGKLSH